MNKGRSSFLKVFLVLYVVFVICLIFGLKNHYKRKFSKEKVELMLSEVSKLRDKTDDLCKYAIKGDPKEVGRNYVKINFWCTDKNSARSTMSLAIFNKSPTFLEVMSEYARIINFDVSLIKSQKWICKLNQKLIIDELTIIPEAADIDCYDKEIN